MKHLTTIIFATVSFLLPITADGMSYREKYAEVLEHFSQSEGDSLRYAAALFLIDNMPAHSSPCGVQMENFKHRIDFINTRNGIRELNEAWNLSGRDGGVSVLPDSSVVTSQMLISNINAAFEAWETAPWGKDTDFATFCDYILPYRCSGEHIGGNWRQALREEYVGVISGVTDILRAFAMVKSAVYNNIALSNAYCPYELDAITTHKIGRAECGQRAIVLVDALRALGIPAAIDFTPVWADYSSMSHGWVAVIGKNGVTYTVHEDDSVARAINPIDASVFVPLYNVMAEDHCPYSIKQSKTPVKVYREGFGIVDTSASARPGFLSNVCMRDVSAAYGLTSSITLNSDIDTEVMLCSYVSARDWMPIASAKATNGRVEFDNVGSNAVLTAYVIENGVHRYITSPFLSDCDGIKRLLLANTNKKISIRINRKYPLCQYIADVWGFMRGGVFLGSDSPDFLGADTLAVIPTMPYGITEIGSHSIMPYLFLRYKAPDGNRSSLSELQFLVNDIGDTPMQLSGKYTASGIYASHLEYLHDNNTATYCRAQDRGYTITVDLGEGRASRVDSIRFAPSTDLNFVEKGHLYELYYFDTAWHLIGRQVAHEESLEFGDVPSGALLLLKDKTAGKEERIFEYRDGMQVWH